VKQFSGGKAEAEGIVYQVKNPERKKENKVGGRSHIGARVIAF